MLIQIVSIFLFDIFPISQLTGLVYVRYIEFSMLVSPRGFAYAKMNQLCEFMLNRNMDWVSFI